MPSKSEAGHLQDRVWKPVADNFNLRKNRVDVRKIGRRQFKIDTPKVFFKTVLPGRAGDRGDPGFLRQ